MAIRKRLPILPLKDMVIFPYMIYPLLIGRQISVDALQEAMVIDRQVFLCSQKRPNIEDPKPSDLNRIGVVARVLQLMKLPNGAIKILVEGLIRAKAIRVYAKGGFYKSETRVIQYRQIKSSLENEALLRNIITQFHDYVRLNRRLPEEILTTLGSIDDPQRLADTISAHIIHRPDVKQKILEAKDLKGQLLELSLLLSSEIEILKLEQKIDGSVKDHFSKSQREFYLQQQLKVIKEELGEGEESVEDLELEKKLKKASLSKEARAKADSELGKLKKMHPFSAEAAVVRNYLDWIANLPWQQKTNDRANIKKVKSILDGDHYGLEKAKKRIFEHLAVIRLAKKVKGPILCFVGPPGVGKTSLGRSIATALGRKFVRMSLGGVRDEAEIRGHRRTYIGSIPGRIIQSLRKAGSSNPVFLLDEIDKLSHDFHGDPAAALLEVLDPEQNYTFVDHFLEVEYDLSNILFIPTANTLSGIPPALVDRMEIIRLPGYLEFEKVNIARRYLIPKLQPEHGLVKIKIEFSEKALLHIIRNYTREAGVRELERKLKAVFRRMAEEVVLDGRKKEFVADVRAIENFLGVPDYLEPDDYSKPVVGVAIGLAWTQFGGEVLPVEVAVMKGKEKLSMTGKLGKVMQESAQAALSFIRENAKDFKIKKDFFSRSEIHIHIPEGAVDKDGPSAGITMATAIISALSGKPVRPRLAMTGEITLRGDVLPVGGLNEKILAAKRSKIRYIIIPAKNQKDLKELAPELKKGLNIILVNNYKEVYERAFE
ncbi:MAG: endopeptidase La [candidate division Zixibacteria bacterium CG_4_9_14_3_um_filter_46_8]|nr:MAG: endopeptidase La [candidate division Zixibacteria bacterium CG_4_9_14_3_um_filter_46_8]